MNTKISSISGFTLIEVMVSISIMSVILVAIMTVFFSMNDISHKTELNRQLQGNIKNMLEFMAEDIRVDGIAENCQVLGADPQEFWCSKGGNKYYLARSDGDDTWVPTTGSDCSDITAQCRLVMNGTPLSNSFISVQELSFEVLGSDSLARLSVHMTLRPALFQGIQPEEIQRNTLTIQTTLSEHFLFQ
ncbi:type II secretion system GspH family protein [Candidatus Gracilibacteria bacterium]|nr:type II secretion system GspH family protein [Candidatus Gracilibacteria bacterium]